MEALIGPLSAPDAEAAGSHASPGMHRKHYSPATKVLVTDALPSARVAYVWWRQPRESANSIRMPADPAQYARQLYAVLHRLDSESLDYIVVEPVPESEAWAGIRDQVKESEFGEYPLRRNRGGLSPHTWYSRPTFGDDDRIRRPGR